MTLLEEALSAERDGALERAHDLLAAALEQAQGRERAIPLAHLARNHLRRGQHELASQALDHAVAIAPDSAELYCERGNLRQDLGDWSRAIDDYDQALRLRPGFAEAVFNKGNALRALGRRDAAAAAFGQAAILRPNLAEAHNNLGNLHFDAGRYDDAIPCYRAALKVRPAFVEARFNLGNAFKGLDRFEESLAAYTEVGRIAPDYAPAWNNAGEVLERLGRVPDALHCYTQAIAKDPRLPQPRRNLGTLLLQQGRIGEALPCFEAAVALAPKWGDALASLLHCKLHACDWADVDDLTNRVRAAVAKGDLVPPFVTATLDLPSDVQTAAAIRWASTFAVPLASRLAPRRPERWQRIRIGYLSGDLHAHATAFLVAELLELHDRSAFEINAYSYGPDDGSAIRDRLVAAVDSFVDLRGLDDRQSAELIHEDGVDILVDLKGYTLGARSQILAYRPASIQVNWLGFPGSMGADFIDYVIADRIVAPERFQVDCVERIVALPDCFQPNDSKRHRPHGVSRSACGLPDDVFVFCSFNNSYKIMPATFDIWMRLLAQVPGSVLWLLKANDLVETNLRREAVARGVAADRLIFAPRLAPEPHLDRHAAADLFLDSQPVNALTTASDALWAGLPVLTMLGRTVAGRGCASLLAAVDLPELVAADAASYEGMALRLATEPGLLPTIREKLRTNRATAPLFDTVRFAGNLEAAYRQMVDTAALGQEPQAFAV